MSAFKARTYRGFVENRQRGYEKIDVNGKTYAGSWIDGNDHLGGNGDEDYIVETFDLEDGPISGHFTGNLIVQGTFCVNTGRCDKLGRFIFSRDIIKVKDSNGYTRFIRVEWSEVSGFVQKDTENEEVCSYNYSLSEIVGTEFEDLETIKRNSFAIKVGDKVKVVNSGYCYPLYTEWVLKNAEDYAVYYAFNHHNLTDISIFKVVAMAPRSEDLKHQILCLIQSDDDDCYLIDVRGLRKYDSTRTF